MGRKRRSQKGGLEIGINKPLNPNQGWLDPSTGGDIKHLISDIVGIVYASIDSIISGIGTMETIIELPSDMGKAFTAKNAPNPGSIHIP